MCVTSQIRQWTNLPLELLHDVLQKVLVEVLPAQEGVSVGGLDLKDPLLDLQDGYIKGAPSQVVYCDAKTATGTLNEFCEQ